jgi:hypothetical protein
MAWHVAGYILDSGHSPPHVEGLTKLARIRQDLLSFIHASKESYELSRSAKKWRKHTIQWNRVFLMNQNFAKNEIITKFDFVCLCSLSFVWHLSSSARGYNHNLRILRSGWKSSGELRYRRSQTPFRDLVSLRVLSNMLMFAARSSEVIKHMDARKNLTAAGDEADRKSRTLIMCQISM